MIPQEINIELQIREERQYNFWMPDFYSFEKAERASRRRYKKQAEKYPLLVLTGDVKQEDPVELQALRNRQSEEYCKKHRDHVHENFKRVREILASLSNYVSMDELRALHTYRLKLLPRGVEYDLNYYSRKLKEYENGA